MENPSITMSIDAGPKKGETLDCSNGRVIRIGRVIRGNTLAIKDPGISQKHLTVAFHRRISRWTVTDHNTSNGTAVNGAVISTDTPFPLADGDTIKIGYKTSISVKISDLTLVPAPSTLEKEAGKVLGSISKQDVDVKKISAPILAPEPRMRRGRRVVVAAVTSPMEVEKQVGKSGSYSGRGSIKQDADVKKISALTLAPDHGTKRRRVSAAVTSMMEKEKVVEMEKHAGKGGSDKQNVDVKAISAPSLGSDHRTKRGRRAVAASVTSLMEKGKVVEMEKQSGKGGSDKQNVDAKEISAPSLGSDHRTKRRRGTVAAAVTSLMEKGKVVDMEKLSGKGGSYSARGLVKQDVDVKEISAPSLAPEPRKRRGRQITVTSLMEKGKVVEADKQAGKGGSYCARGSIEEDVDVKEISAPTLVLDHRAKLGKRTVAGTVSSPMEEEKVVVEKQAGKGGSYCARGSIEQDVDVKEISAPTLVSDHQAKRGRRTVAAAVTSPMEEEKVVEVEKQAGKGGCYSARSSIKQDVKENSAPILAPAPRTKRGRRITYLMEEEKVVETEKHAGKGGSYSGRGSIKQGVDENHRKGRFQRKRGNESTGVCRNAKALERVAVEGDTTSAEVWVGVLKEKDEERGVVHDNAEGKTKNGGRGRSRVKISADSTTVLPKGAPLEPVDVKRKTRRAVKALPIPKEDDEALEMIEGVVKDGGKGPAHTKRGGGSARISWKDEVPEPVVPLRRGKVTRASTMIKEDEKETKEEKVQKTIKNRVKQTEISKKGSRSTRISRKDKVSELVEIEEEIVGSLSRHLEVTEAIQKEDVIVELGKKKKKSNVKDNPIGDGEILAVRRDVSFAVEETDNHKDAIMSESNRSSDLDLPNKKELVYSWSSFSEIRGIPNTTSKYREDRMINCHATPFEARVERALNKGISESSSSVDFEA